MDEPISKTLPAYMCDSYATNGQPDYKSVCQRCALLDANEQRCIPRAWKSRCRYYEPHQVGQTC